MTSNAAKDKRRANHVLQRWMERETRIVTRRVRSKESPLIDSKLYAKMAEPLQSVDGDAPSSLSRIAEVMDS